MHYHVSFYGHSIYIFHVTLKKCSFNTISLNIFDRVPVPDRCTDVLDKIQQPEAQDRRGSTH